MMVGLSLCVVCFLFALVLCWLDKKAETEDKKIENTHEPIEEEQFRMSDIKEFKLAFWICLVYGVMMYGCLESFLESLD